MYARGEGDRPAPGTLNQLFFKALRRAMPDAMLFHRDGAWHPIAHATIRDRVRRMALGLRSLGVRPGDRVAILSENPVLNEEDALFAHITSIRWALQAQMRTYLAARAPHRLSCRDAPSCF